MPTETMHGKVEVVKWPECAGTITLAANAEAGEILSCPDCGTRLEVKSVSPPQLEKAPSVEEDWGE